MDGAYRKITAVVLAGGDQGDRLASAAGVATKALVPIEGRPMAWYVLRALEASRSVSETIFVGPGSDGLGGGRLRAVPAGQRFAQSLALGLGAALAVTPDTPMLVTTADVPWLSPEAVDRFVTAAGEAELAYPIVPERAALADFPTHRRTFVRLKQGRFTGGNLMLLKPQLVGPLLELIDRLYLSRKNPVALAGLMGPGTLLALMFGRADLNRLERLASERLGGSVRAVVTDDACLAADVDRGDQLGEPPVIPAVRHAAR
ncbi:MAG: NTP transferase domain-containing protein [Trueperaceae bacterium]